MRGREIAFPPGDSRNDLLGPLPGGLLHPEDRMTTKRARDLVPGEDALMLRLSGEPEVKLVVSRWGEFKASVEALGVTDADEIRYIDWSRHGNPPAIERDDDGKVIIE